MNLENYPEETGPYSHFTDTKVAGRLGESLGRATSYIRVERGHLKCELNRVLLEEYWNGKKRSGELRVGYRDLSNTKLPVPLPFAGLASSYRASTAISIDAAAIYSGSRVVFEDEIAKVLAHEFKHADDEERRLPRMCLFLDKLAYALVMIWGCLVFHWQDNNKPHCGIYEQKLSAVSIYRYRKFSLAEHRACEYASKNWEFFRRFVSVTFEPDP